MNENEQSTRRDLVGDDAPDLSGDGRPEKFVKVAVRRGRPPVAKAKVSTTIRLSPEVVNHFKLGGSGWQSRIDQALREWIRQHGMT